MVPLVQPPTSRAYFLTVQQIRSQATYLGKSRVPAEGSHKGLDFLVHSQHLKIQVLVQVYVLEEWNIRFEYCSFPPTLG